MRVINIGPLTELNVFEIEANEQVGHKTPTFGRGRLDHIGLHAASLDDFDEIRSRLMAAGATDGTVTDFGRKLSRFCLDPDRMEREVLVAKPRARPGPAGSRIPPIPIARPAQSIRAGRGPIDQLRGLRAMSSQALAAVRDATASVAAVLLACGRVTGSTALRVMAVTRGVAVFARFLQALLLEKFEPQRVLRSLGETR